MLSSAIFVVSLTRGGLRHNVEDRIYSPEDGETNVTPRDITGLPTEEQVKLITLWFQALFEDPNNELPLGEKDDPYRYVYLWGGPYDARDQIGDTFAGSASDEAIEAAIDKVQREGTFEWAPTSLHPDRQALEDEARAENADTWSPSLDDIRRRLESGVQPQFGDPFEIQERITLRSEIAQLRELLEQHAPQHAGIGHNNPPEAIALTSELIMNVTVAIKEMNAEVQKPAPDVGAFVEATSKLEKVLAWVGRKLDKSADGFMTAIGVALAADLAGLPVFEKIAQVFNAALEWLNTVTLPL